MEIAYSLLKMNRVQISLCLESKAIKNLFGSMPDAVPRSLLHLRILDFVIICATFAFRFTLDPAHQECHPMALHARMWNSILSSIHSTSPNKLFAACPFAFITLRWFRVSIFRLRKVAILFIQAHKTSTLGPRFSAQPLAYHIYWCCCSFFC